MKAWTSALTRTLALLLGAIAAATAMDFETVDRGGSSGIADPLRDAYRSGDLFREFWALHKSNSLPVPAAPEVDFANKMVVVLFWGEKNTGGYSIEVTSVEERGDDLVVNYETDEPGPGGIVTQALTQPYHIISVDKSDKEVVFEGSAKAKPPPPFPKYIVSFESEATEDRIRALSPAVTGVKMLFKGKMAFVDFDPTRISEDEARGLLEGLEGVSSIEEERVI